MEKKIKELKVLFLLLFLGFLFWALTFFTVNEMRQFSLYFFMLCFKSSKKKFSFALCSLYSNRSHAFKSLPSCHTLLTFLWLSIIFHYFFYFMHKRIELIRKYFIDNCFFIWYRWFAFGYLLYLSRVRSFIITRILCICV